MSSYFQAQKIRIDSTLQNILPMPTQHLNQIHEAMRYCVLDGGKRIRPLLCIAVTEMLGGHSEEALIPACAIELIHSYSLIHDDLPCLDNDDLRRGKATCHKKFGEAIALLTGDALLTLAFGLLSSVKDSKKAQRLATEIAAAAGTFGMIGGQGMELDLNGMEMDLPTLNAIHIHKTGQLIKGSCLAGAVMA